MSTQEIFKRILDYPIAIVCVAVALILSVVYFVRGSVEPQMQNQIFDLTKERDGLAANRKNSIRIDEDLDRINKLIADVEKRTMISEERSSNIAYLYEVENLFDVEMLSVSHGGAVDPDKKSKLFNSLQTRVIVPFDVSVSGTFNSVLEYMQGVRKGEKLARVRSVNIASSATLDGTVNADLGIHVLGEAAAQ